MEFILDLLHKSVDEGDKLGASFVEARYDDLSLTTINYTNERISEASNLRRKGIGIMVYYDGTPGYCFTPNLTADEIVNVTREAFSTAKSTNAKNQIKMHIDERETIKQKVSRNITKHPNTVSFEDKLEMLKRGISSIKENVNKDLLKSTTGLYGELWGDKIFMNSEGSEIQWNPMILDMRFSAIAMKDGRQSVGGDGFGTSLGLEFYEKEQTTPEHLGMNAGKWCMEQTESKPASSGKQRALVGSRLTGVLAHESFGHLSESDFVITGMSPLADRVGEKLGSEQATIIDEGVPENNSGLYLPFDDQGSPTEKTVLLDKGVLLGYLHNRGSAKKMGVTSTGNSRAIHFMHPPIPRMKNTYFGTGDLSKDEALELLDTGIYAIDSSGGQVSLDGNFLFTCSRGYYVEKGEIKYPIRDAALSGQILEFIKHVIGATKDMKLSTGYFGGCGKGAQFPLPVGLGGPELLIDEVLIGGAK